MFLNLIFQFTKILKNEEKIDDYSLQELKQLIKVFEKIIEIYYKFVIKDTEALYFIEEQNKWNPSVYSKYLKAYK